MGNLANSATNVATNNQAVLDQLVENNATLVAANAKLVSTNGRLTRDNTKLRLAASNTSCRSNNSCHRDLVPHNRAVTNGWTIGGYCHTHRYGAEKDHGRSTCKWCSKNHKDGATRANIMNDSTAKKGWNA